VRTKVQAADERTFLGWPHRDDGPWRVILTWRRERRRMVCTGFAVELMPGAKTEPVTTTLLRSVPALKLIAAERERLFELAADFISADELEMEINSEADVVMASGVADELRLRRELWDAPRQRGRPVRHGTDHYRTVASVYSTALAAGRPPLEAVQKHWNGSPRPTASRWVARARQLGYLPQTTRGQALGNNDLVGTKQSGSTRGRGAPSA
jgi:hypothetical protein